MLVYPVQDPQLAQSSLLLACPDTDAALVVDPERDIDRYLDLAARYGLHIVAAAETHLHADFLSGLREFAEQGLRVYASDAGAPDVRYEWLLDSDYDYRLLTHGDTFPVGSLQVEAIHTPGHSPEHLSYLVRDGNLPLGLATGDFLFVEGLGTPRLVNASQGDSTPPSEASDEYRRALSRLRELPGETVVWPLHRSGTRCGYAPSMRVATTLDKERMSNPVVTANEDDLTTALEQPYPVPPAYFSRMNRLNRSGPPLLDDLPRPARLSRNEIIPLTHSDAVVFLDTRMRRMEFMARHLPYSLYIPLDAGFLDVAGAFLEPETPIYLVAYQEQVEPATRGLVRLGLDRIAGYVLPSVLQALPLRYQRTTPAIGFDELDILSQRPGFLPVDVRSPREFAAGHWSGAVNLPFVQLKEHLDQIPQGQTLLVYSERGRRAAFAAPYLERCGFTVAYVNASLPDALEAA